MENYYFQEDFGLDDLNPLNWVKKIWEGIKSALWTVLIVILSIIGIIIFFKWILPMLTQKSRSRPVRYAAPPPSYPPYQPQGYPPSYPPPVYNAPPSYNPQQPPSYPPQGYPAQQPPYNPQQPMYPAPPLNGRS